MTGLVLLTSLAVTLVMPGPAAAQTPAQAPAQTPAPAPATPPAATDKPGSPTQPAEPFAQDTTLTAKTMVYVKGTGTWDKAFDTITASFKKIKTYLDKEELKPDGLPMTIFTATDDTGFEYQAAVPVAEAPKNPPRDDIAVGQSPDGKALNSSIAARMTISTIPMRRSPITSMTSGSRPRTCSSRNM